MKNIEKYQNTQDALDAYSKLNTRESFVSNRETKSSLCETKRYMRKMRQKLKTALIVGVCILFAPIVAPLLVYLYATIVILDIGGGWL